MGRTKQTAAKSTGGSVFGEGGPSPKRRKTSQAWDAKTARQQRKAKQKRDQQRKSGRAAMNPPPGMKPLPKKPSKEPPKDPPVPTPEDSNDQSESDSSSGVPAEEVTMEEMAAGMKMSPDAASSSGGVTLEEAKLVENVLASMAKEASIPDKIASSPRDDVAIPSPQSVPSSAEPEPDPESNSSGCVMPVVPTVAPVEEDGDGPDRTTSSNLVVGRTPSVSQSQELATTAMSSTNADNPSSVLSADYTKVGLPIWIWHWARTLKPCPNMLHSI